MRHAAHHCFHTHQQLRQKAPTWRVRRAWLSLPIGLLLAILGSVYALADDTKAPASKPEQSQIPVKVAALSSIAVAAQTRVSTTVTARQHIDITVQASGVVENVSAKVGDRLAAGDTLLELDCREANLNQQAALAAKQVANGEFQRAKSLHASKRLSEQAYLQISANSQQANAAYGQASLRVSHCTLSAPFSGMVTSVNAVEGQHLMAGTPTIRLLNTEDLEIAVKLPVADVAVFIDNGSKSTDEQANSTELHVGDDRYPLELTAAPEWIDPSSQQRELRFAVKPNQAGRRPLAGAVAWLVAQGNSPTLPVDYLVERDGKLGYFIIDDDSARYIALDDAKPGRAARLPAAALEGEGAQTELVISGQQRLNDGDAITRVGTTP